jgi:hypothetical protein
MIPAHRFAETIETSESSSNYKLLHRVTKMKSYVLDDPDAMLLPGYDAIPSAVSINSPEREVERETLMYCFSLPIDGKQSIAVALRMQLMKFCYVEHRIPLPIARHLIKPLKPKFKI